MFKNKVLFYFVPLFFLTFYIACATTKDELKAMDRSQDIHTHLEQLNGDFHKAQLANITLLAPENFRQAQLHLDKANKLRLKEGNPQKILSLMEEAKTSLNRAQGFARISSDSYPETIKARNAAIASKAQILGKQFEEAEKEFSRLGRAIERNDLQWALKYKRGVTLKYKSLEVEAIKKATTEDIEHIIQQAIQLKASKIMPSTLRKVETDLANLKSLIASRPFDEPAIQQLKRKALYNAHRLLHLTQEANEISQNGPERVTLEIEKLLSNIRQQVSPYDDMKEYDFSTQVSDLELLLRQLQLDRENLSHKSQVLENKLVGQLSKEQLLERVQSLFRPEEAIVYQDNRGLVIRLKAINYPLNGVRVQPENYALLEKVEKAISFFEAPQIGVEGHTDNTGSRSVNTRISLRRAQNVAQYLIKGGAINPENIESRGHADNQPLASNATKEGRQINRRIDILIKM